MTKTIKCLFFVLLLGGCAQNEGTTFSEFVLEDAQQASIMAARIDDKLAVKCWAYLQEKTEAASPDGTNPRGEVVGALSAYQKARNIRRTVSNLGVSDQFKLECGPMLIDSAGAVSRIGVRTLLPF